LEQAMVDPAKVAAAREVQSRYYQEAERWWANKPDKFAP
jgi:hypothetical protein